MRPKHPSQLRPVGTKRAQGVWRELLECRIRGNECRQLAGLAQALIQHLTRLQDSLSAIRYGIGMALLDSLDSEACPGERIRSRGGVEEGRQAGFSHQT